MNLGGRIVGDEELGVAGIASAPMEALVDEGLDVRHVQLNGAASGEVENETPEHGLRGKLGISDSPNPRLGRR